MYDPAIYITALIFIIITVFIIIDSMLCSWVPIWFKLLHPKLGKSTIPGSGYILFIKYLIYVSQLTP